MHNGAGYFFVRLKACKLSDHKVVMAGCHVTHAAVHCRDPGTATCGQFAFSTPTERAAIIAALGDALIKDLNATADVCARQIKPALDAPFLSTGIAWWNPLIMVGQAILSFLARVCA